MAFSVISTSAVPALAEEAEAETVEEVVDVVEDVNESEEGDDTVIEVPEEGEDEGGSEIIVDIPVDEGDEGTDGIGVVNFDDNADDVAVTAEAPEGTFPEGTEMTAVTVDDQTVLDLIQETAGEDAEILAAIDITFTNEGETVQPTDAAVKVAFAAAGLTYSDDLRIVHVHEDEEQNLTATVLEPEAVTETEEGGVAFDADSFSVYAVVGHGETSRLTVKFMNGTNLIASTVVKKTDIDATTVDGKSLFDQIIYDPGAGTLGSGQVFRGWTTNTDYTDADVATGKNIETVRDEVKAKLNEGVDDGAELTYYAMIYNVFNIVYRDEAKTVIKNDSVLTKAATADYTINEPYTPKTSDQEFQGWHISPKDNATLADGTAVTETDTYKNLTALKLSGSIELNVDAPKGAWLIFRENGKNVSYTAPKFYEKNETTEDPGAPTRNGYIFGGWYENAEGTGNAFTFGSTLGATTTLYAKWTPVETAKYTVIIWKQNLAADGYDFVEAVVKSGQTGTTPTAVNASTGAVNGATYNGETGFHFKETDQASKTIAPEGNTVVNVYYDRNEYTLTFRAYKYTATTGNQGTQYGLVNGEYVELSRGYDGNWYYGSGYNWTRYNGTRYTRSSSQETVKEIKALYGQFIGDNFPIEGYTTSRWAPQNTTLYNQVLVYIDIMPAGNVTFNSDSGDGKDTMYMELYVEALPGQTGTRTWNGKSFVKYGNTITCKYNFFTEAEDFLDLTGYEKYGSDPAFGDNGRADPGDGGTIRFYYTRKEYVVNFMDGGYFDGNENPVEEKNRGTLSTSEKFLYGADISSQNNVEPADYSGYVFSGWYIDSACTHPYTFTTMPEGGVTVYAKWVKVQYRVFLHPNVPTSDTSFSMGEQSTSFRVDAGKKIADGNSIDARRNDYELVGWYTDEGCTQQFNFDAYTLNDNNTVEYSKTQPTELDKYGNPTDTINKDANRPWVTRSKDLYAKWRSKLLGADGITVVYEAGDGTFPSESGGGTTYKDPLLYKDLAMSTATTATTPTNAEKYEFLHWEVLKYENEAFVETGETVLPGDTFEVKKAYAQVTENEGSTAQKPSYTYTVKLRAVYKEKGTEKKTHIYWFANNGTTDKYADENLSMNQPVNIEPADKFTYLGYVFVGWARWPEGEKPTSSTDTTNLWLVYDAAHNKFTCDGVDVTKVACDEANPYHDLYAVWKNVGVYHVRYSSDPAKVYDYTMPREEGGKVTTLIEHLHSDTHLYGGYYNYDEFNKTTVAYTALSVKDDAAATDFQKTYWAKKTAFTTEPATNMTPEAGKTYYIKEVPNRYLQPFNQFYFKENYAGFLTQMFEMTSIDDGRYQEFGFASLKEDYTADTSYNYNYAGVISSKIVAKTRSHAYDSLTFSTTGTNVTNKTQVRNVVNMTGVDNALGYVAAVDITQIYHDNVDDPVYKVTKSFKGVCFNFVPYYITLDGITVYGQIRKVNCGAGYKSTFVPTNSVISDAEKEALVYKQ